MEERMWVVKKRERNRAVKSF